MKSENRTVRLEYLKFGKVVTGAGGAIVRNAEQKMTSCSAGLSRELRLSLSPGAITHPLDLDASLLAATCRDRGCLVVRMFQYSRSVAPSLVLARIRFSSESGDGQPGRQFPLMTAAIAPPGDWQFSRLLRGGLAPMSAAPDTLDDVSAGSEQKAPLEFALAPDTPPDAAVLRQVHTIISGLAADGRIALGSKCFNGEGEFLEALARVLQLAGVDSGNRPELVAVCGLAEQRGMGDIEYYPELALQPASSALPAKLEHRARQDFGWQDIVANSTRAIYASDSGSRRQRIRERFGLILETLGGGATNFPRHAAANPVHPAQRIAPARRAYYGEAPQVVAREAQRVPDIATVMRQARNTFVAAPASRRPQATEVWLMAHHGRAVAGGSAARTEFRISLLPGMLDAAERRMRDSPPTQAEVISALKRFTIDHWGIFPEEWRNIETHDLLAAALGSVFAPNTTYDFFSRNSLLLQARSAISGVDRAQLVFECLRFRIERYVMPPPDAEVFAAAEELRSANPHQFMARLDELAPLLERAISGREELEAKLTADRLIERLKPVIRSVEGSATRFR